MTQTTVGGGAVRGAAPATYVWTRRGILSVSAGVLILLAIIAGAYALQNTPGYGARAAFSLLVGAALGIVFERGRFCFFCIFRDFIEGRNATGLFAVLAALAVGGIGYAVIFGAFLPNEFSGRLPPDAHIGPVSWVLVVAGVAFGIGMALSGACISGHLYRLGQGYVRAPLALVGSAVGFGLGFYTWQSVYLSTLSRAPVAWLPATLGYGGSVVAHLAVLLALGFVLLRWLPAAEPNEGGSWTPSRIADGLLQRRWNPLATGALVGIIGTFAYFRVEPLGVTSQIASSSRTVMENAGLIGDRLNGLDTFAGCAAVVVQAITENGWLIGGLVLGSLGIVLVARRFKLSQLTPRNSLTALLGGVLMGWSSMLALGCTVGTLLSGTSAFAVSGWVFGAAVFAGVWGGVRLGLQNL